jgi:hypothetical protein
MGSQRRDESWGSYQARLEDIVNTRREKQMKLAGKITTVVIDQIVKDIIRPGPAPEERECYDMAKELRDHFDIINARVVDVLKKEKVDFQE